MTRKRLLVLIAILVLGCQAAQVNAADKESPWLMVGSALVNNHMQIVYLRKGPQGAIHAYHVNDMPDAKTVIEDISKDYVLLGAGSRHYKLWMYLNRSGEPVAMTSHSDGLVQQAQVDAGRPGLREQITAEQLRPRSTFKIPDGGAGQTQTKTQYPVAESPSAKRQSLIPIDGAGEWPLP